MIAPEQWLPSGSDMADAWDGQPVEPEPTVAEVVCALLIEERDAAVARAERAEAERDELRCGIRVGLACLSDAAGRGAAFPLRTLTEAADEMSAARARADTAAADHRAALTAQRDAEKKLVALEERFGVAAVADALKRGWPDA